MKLGAYIAQTDERNTDLAVTNLLGVSIEKRFVPSIANTVGTDLSKYKVVHPGEFAYGPVTSRNGDKVSIARLHGDAEPGLPVKLQTPVPGGVGLLTRLALMENLLIAKKNRE